MTLYQKLVIGIGERGGVARLDRSLNWDQARPLVLLPSFVDTAGCGGLTPKIPRRFERHLAPYDSLLQLGPRLGSPSAQRPLRSSKVTGTSITLPSRLTRAVRVWPGLLPLRTNMKS
jgi:hypothetical protein